MLSFVQCVVDLHVPAHADKPCNDPLIARLCPEPHVEGLAELGPAELVLSAPSAPDGGGLGIAMQLTNTDLLTVVGNLLGAQPGGGDARRG